MAHRANTSGPRLCWLNNTVIVTAAASPSAPLHPSNQWGTHTSQATTSHSPKHLYAAADGLRLCADATASSDVDAITSSPSL